MGAALLIAIWLGVLGYGLVYHGMATLAGRQVNLGEVLLGNAA